MRGAARVELDILEVHAREMLEEFAHVAFDDVAELVRGDGVADEHRAALVLDRLALAFSTGRDNHRLELEGLALRRPRCAAPRCRD